MSNFAVMPLIDYQNTCDAIREKTGTTDLVKSGEMAKKIMGISGGDYSKGYQDARQSFWHALQQGGNRTNYEAFFLGSYWTDNSFKPIYDLNPTAVKQMFYSSPITNLKQLLIDCGVVLNTSKADYFTQMFQQAKVTHLPIIDMSNATNVTQFCSYTPVVEIEKIISHKNIPWNNSFFQCSELTEIRFEGEIGSNGLSFADSKKLSRESLLSIVNALKDFSAENTIINDLTLTQETPSILCEYTLTPGKTYITSFKDVMENGESGEFVPTYNDFSAVAENINVYGVGEKLGVHYIVDVWAAPDDYTFNLVIYQEGNQLKELRYLENKQTGEISLNGQAGDRICVKVKADSSYAITLGATNLNKLTEQEKAVATKKGWILQ